MTAQKVQVGCSVFGMVLAFDGVAFLFIRPHGCGLVLFPLINIFGTGDFF